MEGSCTVIDWFAFLRKAKQRRTCLIFSTPLLQNSNLFGVPVFEFEFQFPFLWFQRSVPEILESPKLNSGFWVALLSHQHIRMQLGIYQSNADHYQSSIMKNFFATFLCLASVWLSSFGGVVVNDEGIAPATLLQGNDTLPESSQMVFGTHLNRNWLSTN